MVEEIYPLARSLALAPLRSASGPEVKGSAIRCGIGNYSPERGRALLTFITELSASLGKQCASFNPPSFFPSVSPPQQPRLASILFRRARRDRAGFDLPLFSSFPSLPPVFSVPVLLSRRRDAPRRTFFSLHP